MMRLAIFAAALALLSPVAWIAWWALNEALLFAGAPYIIRALWVAGVAVVASGMAAIVADELV